MIIRSKLIKVPYLLFTRRNPNYRWFFLIAAIPFTVYIVLGLEYGVISPYSISALLCIIQYFYPTIFGWIIITSIYCLMALYDLHGILGEISRLIDGLRPHVFWNVSDSVFSISLFVISVSFTIILFKLHPFKKGWTMGLGKDRGDHNKKPRGQIATNDKAYKAMVDKM